MKFYTTIIAALAAASLASFAKAADTGAGDIVDLLQSKKIAAEVQGEEIRTIQVRVRRLVAAALTVRVPVGTLFVSKSGAVQNMVVREEATFTLNDESWQNAQLAVACTNLHRPIPDGEARFSIQRTPNQRQLATVLPKLDREEFAVQQAAIWILTDDAGMRDLQILIVETRSGFGLVSKGPLITAADAARALRLIAEAGCDVTEFSIWSERLRIQKEAADAGFDALLARYPVTQPRRRK